MTKSMAVIVMACEIYLFYAKKKKKEDDVIGVLKTSFLTAHKRDTTCKDDVVDHDHSVRTQRTKSKSTQTISYPKYFLDRNGVHEEFQYHQQSQTIL